MTDVNKILNIEAIKSGDVDLDRFNILSKEDKDAIVGQVMVVEGHNGKTHGQKGHRKAYLTFELDTDGKLVDICVTVPSSGEVFSFFQ